MKALDIEPFADGVITLWDRIGRFTYYAVDTGETIGLLTFAGRAPGRLVCLCREGLRVYEQRNAEIRSWAEEGCPHETIWREHQERIGRDTRPTMPVNVGALVE